MPDHTTDFEAFQSAMIAEAERHSTIVAQADALVSEAWRTIAEGLRDERESFVAFAHILERWRYVSTGTALTQRPKRKAIPRTVRQSVMERDAYRCVLCGDWHDLQLDHIYPTCRGGDDTAENLRVLCGECNSRKGGTL